MDENFFVSGHDYEIEIFLELPESPVNRELGMFMVGIELFTEDGYEVGSISKPVTNFFFKKKSFIISIPDKIKIQIRLVSFPSCFISYDSINIWVLGRNSIHSINSLRSFGKKEWLLFFFLKTQLLFFKKKRMKDLPKPESLFPNLPLKFILLNYKLQRTLEELGLAFNFFIIHSHLI